MKQSDPPPIKNEEAMSLSDEQIDDIAGAVDGPQGAEESSWERDRRFARAIETAVREKGGEPEPTAEQEREDDDRLREKMGALLTGVANALRGQPPPLTLWSWHDLPERAAAAIAAIDLGNRVAVNLASREGSEDALLQAYADGRKDGAQWSALASSPVGPAEPTAPAYYVTRFTLDGRHAVCEVATGRVVMRDLDAALAAPVGPETAAPTSELDSAREALTDTFEQKCERNSRVQDRYDELMREGKHGHYETMFRVVREEVEAARAALAGQKGKLNYQGRQTGTPGGEG